MELQEVMDQSTISDFFVDVISEDWKTWDVERIVALRNTLEAFVSGANMLREKFDAAVWAGHSDGSVSEEVTSIRAQRTGDKPGKKAVELTPAELLAKRMKR